MFIVDFVKLPITCRSSLNIDISFRLAYYDKEQVHIPRFRYNLSPLFAGETEICGSRIISTTATPT